MTDDTSASVITLHQPRPKKAKTGAEGAKLYRQRKKRDGLADPTGPAVMVPTALATSATVLTPIIPPPPTVTLRAVTPVGRLDRPRGRRPGARDRRHHHQLLVRPVARVDRDRRLAVPGDWRGRRSRRPVAVPSCAAAA
jgi:hypothetical protein